MIFQFEIDEVEDTNVEKKLMLARGLVMMLHLDKLADYGWQQTAFALLKNFNDLFEKSSELKLMEYLASMSNRSFQFYVMRL